MHFKEGNNNNGCIAKYASWHSTQKSILSIHNSHEYLPKQYSNYLKINEFCKILYCSLYLYGIRNKTTLISVSPIILCFP